MNKKNKICAFAPATIANLNVGFDVLGLALSSIGDKVEITPNGLTHNRITQIDNHSSLPTDVNKNSCTVVIQKMQEQLGKAIYVDVKIKKGFASGSGLGSSSASSAAAAFAYNALIDNHFTREELLPFAAEGERAACGSAHYDNVSPALLGGLILLHNGAPVRLPIPEGWHTVSFFPDIEVNTSSSRSIVAKHASLDVISKQVSSMGAFIAGLYNNDLQLIRQACKDFLVEPFRKILIPYFDEMRQASMDLGGITFGISGSGPSVFAIAPNKETAEKIQSEFNVIYAGKGIETLSFIEDLQKGKGTFLCDEY
ncbi:MAG: homoserine kinase [Capnocytophaga sp.]|nr:homoserine kinase [Capnocytophaga sp.]